MRCPSCSKFVSLEMQDPEEGRSEVDEAGLVTGDVRIVRNCAECSQELKEANLDFELDMTAMISEHREACAETDLELEVVLSPYEDVERVDRRGKPITNPRYQKSLFGAEIEARVTCACGETFSETTTVSTAASAMEELG